MKARKDIVAIFFFTLCGFLLFFYLFSVIFSESSSPKLAAPIESVREKIKYEYGIPVNYYIRKQDKVRPNQSLSTILHSNNISLSIIDKLNTASQPIFDVKKIQKGHKYILYCERDSIETPCFFVYENTRTQFIVYNLLDPGDVKLFNMEIDQVIKKARGIIESSLWNTMVDKKLDPLLAITLEDIYQWTIDFFSLQPGDGFRIIYEEKYVEGESIGSENIIAAEFVHMGEIFLAIPFKIDNKIEFYDKEGNSLRRNFLKAPLKSYRISSGYSNRRFHPILKIYRPHHGVDYAASRGTEVHSVGDGTITETGYQKNGGGRYIKIRHNSVYSTTYMHLEAYAKGIRSGIRVKQDQIIAYVGSSGLATGAHLDFRFYRNGSPVNPLTIETQPVKAVPESQKPEFRLYCDSIINQFEGETFSLDH